MPEPIAAVVLAAGLSTRFGGDKLLYPHAGKPLAAHIADTLVGMPLAHRIAIVPPAPSARGDVFAERGFELVENPDPQQGMGASLALGAQRAIELGAEMLLVCLADMPNVTTEHLTELIAALATSDVVATGFDNSRGPPAVFARRLFPELMVISGDHGARHLLANARLVEAPQVLARDFDTRGDFDQA
ncbi:MAG TPA: nucleotidyltransferase family protein [Devosia sp.]|uniref:nucleotidyltransferase family protein n=1 Tax=Devosia sp. TaxID=1871048 RepID=UPI002DDD18DE|nr:nucleotidyltransferase family protein [Devosia sp.]HEV2514970.1 nucleotidyltransferase family protein [Devosia sp.]